MNQKSLPFVIFASSVGIILLAALLLKLFNPGSSANSAVDVRSKATTNVGLTVFTGTVDQYDTAAGNLIVRSMKFENSNTDLGVWNVLPPVSFNSNSFPSGTTVRIEAEPKSVQVQDKSLTARKINRR